MSKIDQASKDPLREALAPPAHIVIHAVQMAGYSPCRSQRGAVAFVPRGGGSLIGAGWNRRQGPACDGSAECKATCRGTALHAEQAAILSSGTAIEGCDMLHVKIVGGALVASGGPSCLECSKLMLAAGVEGVWLYHEDGWRRYPIKEFHALTLEALVGAAPRREAQCPTHGDPLVCLACEAEEDTRPEWQRPHRVTPPRLRGEPERETQQCAGCHHRWAGETSPVHLCGDCWRKIQAAPRREGWQPLDWDRAAWLTAHVDLGHGIVKRGPFDECSCGERFPAPPSPAAGSPRPGEHER